MRRRDCSAQVPSRRGTESPRCVGRGSRGRHEQRLWLQYSPRGENRPSTSNNLQLRQKSPRSRTRSAYARLHRPGTGPIGVTLAACTLGWMSTVHADTIEPVTAAFHVKKPIVDVRLRSEQVEQDGLPEEADALTLRARLGFETGKAWNCSLLAEAELLWPLVTDYNSTVNGKTQFPIVADPESYEINRLALVNTSLSGTTLTFGRQLI